MDSCISIGTILPARTFFCPSWAYWFRGLSTLVCCRINCTRHTGYFLVSPLSKKDCFCAGGGRDRWAAGRYKEKTGFCAGDAGCCSQLITPVGTVSWWLLLTADKLKWGPSADVLWCQIGLKLMWYSEGIAIFCMVAYLDPHWFAFILVAAGSLLGIRIRNRIQGLKFLSNF